MSQLSRLLTQLNLSAPGGSTVAAFALSECVPEPERLDTFVRMAPALTDEQYWAALGDIWIRSSIPGYHLPVWRTLFRSTRPNRAYLMNEAEQQTLAALPERVTVYRAATPEARNGISWTVSRPVALYFQYIRRAAGNQQIWSTIIDKADAVAFFNRREEAEVIVLDVKDGDAHPPAG